MHSIVSGMFECGWFVGGVSQCACVRALAGERSVFADSSKLCTLSCVRNRGFVLCSARALVYCDTIRGLNAGCVYVCACTRTRKYCVC